MWKLKGRKGRDKNAKSMLQPEVFAAQVQSCGLVEGGHGMDPGLKITMLDYRPTPIRTGHPNTMHYAATSNKYVSSTMGFQTDMPVRPPQQVPKECREHQQGASVYTAEWHPVKRMEDGQVKQEYTSHHGHTGGKGTYQWDQHKTGEIGTVPGFKGNPHIQGFSEGE